MLKLNATLIGEEVVVPILVGARPEDYTPTSVDCARACIPTTLHMKCHHVELAFALTDYKVQGKTLDYIILSIGARGYPPFLSLTSLTVLVSRVRLANHIYVIGMDPAHPETTEHLRKLKHSPVLNIWEASYDASGHWNGDLARAAGNAASERLRSETTTKGKKRKLPSMPRSAIASASASSSFGSSSSSSSSSSASPASTPSSNQMKKKSKSPLTLPREIDRCPITCPAPFVSGSKGKGKAAAVVVSVPRAQAATTATTPATRQLRSSNLKKL